MSSIAFDNVSKSYLKKIALKNISLTFQPNKTTAVIGPSGSGKSTLIQLINGLLRPDNGQVSVFDKKINYDNLSELRKRMGYAVQGT